MASAVLWSYFNLTDENHPVAFIWISKLFNVPLIEVETAVNAESLLEALLIAKLQLNFLISTRAELY